MGISRRKFIAVAGGGIIVAAGGAGGLFASTRTPQAALAPWELAGSAYEEPRRRALSYAILAPNPHNRQPWLVDLDTPNEVHLYADTDRLLPETDPYQRQITVGLGCFLELMVQAANADGHEVTLELFPEGEDTEELDQRPVAIARFAPGERRVDPLFEHVLERRSLKEPYDAKKTVSEDALKTLEQAAGNAVLVGSTNEGERVQALRNLTWEAWLVEYRTPAKLQESIDVMRFGKNEINADPDGIDLGGAFLESLMLAGILTPEALADPDSTAYAEGISMYEALCESAQAFIWVKTADNSRGDQIAAGRSWVRINLAATQISLGIHPMSQALQEFPEMEVHYKAVHDMLGADGETVQMLGRLGYAPEIPPSPRWRLEKKIRRA